MEFTNGWMLERPHPAKRSSKRPHIGEGRWGQVHDSLRAPKSCSSLIYLCCSWVTAPIRSPRSFSHLRQGRHSPPGKIGTTRALFRFTASKEVFHVPAEARAMIEHWHVACDTQKPVPLTTEQLRGAMLSETRTIGSAPPFRRSPTTVESIRPAFLGAPTRMPQGP
jgi:hypothetical protein